MATKTTAAKKAISAPDDIVMAPRSAVTGQSCKEFSVSFALLTSDNQRQVSFGVTRGCIDPNTPLYVISFLLRDLVNGEFQDRVRLLVTIGPEDNDKAQKIMDRGLRSTQKNFLEGPITTKAAALPKGTTEAKPAGAAVAADVKKVLTK